MTAMVIARKEITMKAAISLVVSAFFASCTGAEFVMCFTVTMAALELYGYFADDTTDDKNAS